MKSFLRFLLGIPAIAFLFLAAPAEAQVKRYAIITGDASEIPDSAYKYADANSGCVAVVSVPPSTACVKNHQDMQSALGPHPTQPSACIHHWDCLCGECLIGEPSNPANFNRVSTAQTNAYGQVMSSCGSGFLRDFVRCTADKAKGKACEVRQSPGSGGLLLANPCNIGSGNKFQSESVYRSGSDALDLVLQYNSQAGVHYFELGAFGAK